MGAEHGLERPYRAVHSAAADCTHRAPQPQLLRAQMLERILGAPGLQHIHNFHGLYGWLTAYPTLPQPTVEA
jgi:hypothetical protein